MRTYTYIIVMLCMLSSLTLSSQSEENAGVPVVDYEGLTELLPKSDDQIVVVNFWATWCKPCVKEMPYFNELSRKYADNPSVKVILVSLDMESHMQNRILPFIKERKLHPRVILLDDPDANAWIDKVHPSWSGAIPATLVYKGEHKQFYEQSFHSLDELEQIIKNF